MKNRIHSFFNSQPEAVRREQPQKRDLFGKAGRQWLDNLKLPAAKDKRLKNLLRFLDYHDELIKELSAGKTFVKQCCGQTDLINP